MLAEEATKSPTLKISSYALDGKFNSVKQNKILTLYVLHKKHLTKIAKYRLMFIWSQKALVLLF